MIAFRRRAARRNWSRIRFATARWRYARKAPSCVGSNETRRARLCCSASWTTSLVSMPPRAHAGIRPRAHRRSQVLYHSNSLLAAERLPRRISSSRRRSDVAPSEAGSPREREEGRLLSGDTTAADHVSARRLRETIPGTPARGNRTSAGNSILARRAVTQRHLRLSCSSNDHRSQSGQTERGRPRLRESAAWRGWRTDRPGSSVPRTDPAPPGVRVHRARR